MRLRVRVLGVPVLDVSTDADDDQGPGDVTASGLPPMGRVGFSTWDGPTLPALEVE